MCDLPHFIPPGKPWHKGFAESFNGKLPNERLNREWFHDLDEARALGKTWRQFHNNERPHGALGYRPLAQVAARSDIIARHLTA